MRWVGLAVGAAYVATASQVVAQQAPDQAGGAPTPGVQASVAVEATYDSNVARGDAQTAAARGLKRQDEIYTPSVTIDAYHPLGREAVFLHADAGYDIYQHNRVLNRERVDADGGLKLGVGPCLGTLTGSYGRHQSDLAEIVGPTVRNLRESETVSFDGSCPRTIGFGPTLSVSQNWTTDSAAVMMSSDSRTLDARLGAVYAQPVLGQITLYGDYRKTDFPNRTGLGGHGPMDGYDVYSGGLSYDHHIGARLEGAIQVAYTSLQPYLPSEPGFSGPTFAVDINYKASGRLTAHAHADRDTVPSVQINATYTVEQHYITDVTYEVSSRLNLKLGASYLDRRFNGAALVSGANLSHEAQNSYFGSVNLTIGRRFLVSLDLREEDRLANIRAYDYRSTRASLTVTTKF